MPLDLLKIIKDYHFQFKVSEKKQKVIDDINCNGKGYGFALDMTLSDISWINLGQIHLEIAAYLLKTNVQRLSYCGPEIWVANRAHFKLVVFEEDNDYTRTYCSLFMWVNGKQILQKRCNVDIFDKILNLN